MKKILLLIVLVVFVSGCTQLQTGMQIEQFIEENDIIKIQSMEVIGDEPILTDSPFTFYFEIQNMHDERDVKRVSAELTNWEPCEVEKIYDGTVTETATQSLLEDTKISAGGTEAVEVGFIAKTPTTELPGKCNIQYLIDYDFNTKTSFSGINVIDTVYLSELRRSGKSPTTKPRIDIGIGPLKILFETDVQLPIETGRDLSISMWVENRGTEVYGKIKENAITLKIPEDFLVGKDIDNVCDKFGSDQTKAEKEELGNFYYLTNQEIPIIKGKSSKIRCRFASPSDVGGTEKEYFIIAEMDYTYKIRGEKQVQTKP